MGRLPYTWVARALGSLLLLAAALKMRGLAVDPISAGGIFSSPAFRFAVVEGEILLGVWFISGRNPVGAWLVAVMVFVLFAGVTIYQAGTGVASCGCFGSIRVNPGIALLVDIGALTALAVARPDLNALRTAPLAQLRQQGRAIAGGVVVAGLFLGLLSSAGYLAYGSPEAALAHLRGEPISVQPALLDFGQATPGESRKETVTVVNWTETTVRIMGGRASCACVLTDDLPVSIAPGESRSVTVRMQFSGRLGSFTEWAYFFTDDDSQREISFRLTGRILARVIERSSP